MSLDFSKLVPQGRAKANGVCWSETELELLISLERERGLARNVAADYIRNGISSLEDFDKATKSGFKPLNVEEARKEAEENLAKKGKEAVKISRNKKK